MGIKQRLAEADRLGMAIDEYAAKHIPIGGFADPEYHRLYNEWSIAVQGLENDGVDEQTLMLFVHCPEG